MIRYFLLRIVLPLALFLLVRSVLRSLFATARSTAATPEVPTEVPAAGELKRDPVCGTYVAMTAGITHSAKGQTYYFCSKECRDKYRAA
jgi:YHS domain-containing protein